MGCCGQKRSELAGNRQRELGEPSVVAIRYLRAAPILVRGPITGRHYQFSAENPVVPVDARDAGTLLQTALFQRQY